MLLVVGPIIKTAWNYGVAPVGHVMFGAVEGGATAVADGIANRGVVSANFAKATTNEFAEVAGVSVRNFFYRFAEGFQRIIHGAGSGAPRIGEAISAAVSNSFKGGTGQVLATAIRGLGPWGGALALGYGALIVGGLAMGAFALKAYSRWSIQQKGLEHDLAGKNVWLAGAGSGAVGFAGALMMCNPATAWIGLGALGVGAVGVAGSWAYNGLCKTHWRHSASWPAPFNTIVKWLFEPERSM